MTIRTMDIEDFEKIYDLWIHTEGMGLNTTDDSREGIARYLFRNPNTCFVTEDNGKNKRISPIFILQEPINCHLYEKMGYRQTGKTEVVNERLTLTFYEKKEADRI